MSRLLQRLRRDASARDRPIDYAKSKQLAGSLDCRKRVTLGANRLAPPEVLYFLAADADPQVRAAVASNQATPAQANLLLARDTDETVRCDLATRIAALVPGLATDLQDKLRQSTLAVLDILVRDQVTRVRRILAETLKDVAAAPVDIITRLARDGEIDVAGPVLECSPVLSDDDLLAIIAQSPIPGALAAVARRGVVNAAVADAIGASEDSEAIALLLANPSAQIREEMLDRLVERAPDQPSWHAPMVERPKLPGRLIAKLAEFVSTNQLDRLRERRDIDPASASAIRATVLRRLFETEDAAPPRPAAPRAATGVEALAEARRLHGEACLDEISVLKFVAADALMARAGLAVLAGMTIEMVERVLASHSAKGVTALAWKAKFSMRGAVRLQLELGHIAGASVLQPRRDGSYPLTPEAMTWQLEFLTGVEGL